jgi:stage II sporulation protein AA (anti-sigma F factor antagonist)
VQLLFDSFNEFLIIKFKGELDHHSTEEARKIIDDHYFKDNKKKVILDLRDVVFMDSSGIGLIMGRYKLFKESGGEVFIVSSNPYLDRILQMSGIFKIMKIYSSIDSAIDNN